MDKIFLFDMIFLVLFSLALVIFLTRNRKNLKREGLIYFYRTKLGMNAIEDFSKKRANILRKMKYVVILIAFLLMLVIITLLASNAYGYIKSPRLMRELTNGAPPIAPLIPYFPKVFGMESFFPNFYFSYFIIALAIVAIAHEFAHGVFMRAFKVKIKSTGFIFLGPILGAFVEQDDKELLKKKNSEQMAMLGAGVFANFLLAIIFFVLLILFFNFFYLPSGYIFPGYATTSINTSEIKGFENYSNNLTKILVEEESYFIPVSLYSKLIENESYMSDHFLTVYLESPAIKGNLRGTIVEIDEKKVKDFESFYLEIQNKKPGDVVRIKTIYLGEIEEYEIVLEKHPENSSRGFLGISSLKKEKGFTIRGLISYLLNFKDPNTFYESKYNPSATEFIYYLIWWIALINLFVAMFNMLPFGILDGGRFTYLLFLSLTKSEQKTKKIYKFILSTVWIIFLLILFGWVLAKFLK